MNLQHEDQSEFPADEHIAEAHSLKGKCSPFNSKTAKQAEARRHRKNAEFYANYCNGEQPLVGESIDLDKEFEKAAKLAGELAEKRLFEPDSLNPCAEIPLGDYEVVSPASQAMLEASFGKMSLTVVSLERLGLVIMNEDCTSTLYANVGQELVNRVDGSLHKANVFMEYHVGVFRMTPDTKNWCELVAIMYAYQQIKLGQTDG